MQKKLAMERKTLRALLILSVLVLGMVAGSEGGRGLGVKEDDEVNSPQLLGLGIGGLLGGPFGWGGFLPLLRANPKQTAKSP